MTKPAAPRPDLPSIEGDLAPKKRLDLRAIRQAPVDDAAVAENSRRIGSEWGAQTSLPPGATRTPLASLRIEVPEYLDRALALKAAELRVTKQYLVVKALQEAGYRVEDADLVEDKRKAKRR